MPVSEGADEIKALEQFADRVEEGAGRFNDRAMKREVILGHWPEFSDHTDLDLVPTVFPGDPESSLGDLLVEEGGLFLKCGVSVVHWMGDEVVNGISDQTSVAILNSHA